MFLLLSAVLASVALPVHLAPHVTSPPVWIGRLDQHSRQLVVHNLHPGQHFAVYVNGRLLGTSVARTTVDRIPLHKPFAAGTAFTVVADADRTSRLQRATVDVQNDYLQYRYDLGHTGWNQSETTLTTANVNPATFGHLFSLPVDGYVLAQPLYMSGLTIGGNVYNVAFVATENDSIFAFDTDTGTLLWSVNYSNPGAGAVPIPTAAVRAVDIAPVIGITSTPAIDPDTGTMYFVAAIQQTEAGGGFSYHQFLHAVSIIDGSEVPGSPVDITATAFLNNNSPVPFDPLRQLNRASTLLSNGVVYVSFGSHNDVRGGKPHGWMFAYDASTLALLTFFNTTLDVTNRFYACIWGAGWGPGADALGNIYVATGDGPFDADSGGGNWGDTVLKMSPALAVEDYFTPEDQAVLQQADHDLGSGGVLILPDQPGPRPHLATVAGIEGVIYLLDRDAMGQYTAGGPDNVVQELQGVIGPLRGGPAYYAGPTGTFLYYCGAGNPLQAFQLETSPDDLLVPASRATRPCGTGGTIPEVSSNAALPSTGIVWMTNRPGDKADNPIHLFAYDATDLHHKLIETNVAFWLNLHSQPFLTPTVIGGHVFVGTPNSVEEFGLLSSRARRHGAPSAFPRPRSPGPR